MPPLSMLIKPASGACNMRCGYCFYADEARNRETYSFGMMSEDTMKNVIQKALDFAEGSLSIGFQGGEPTLRGLGFFRAFCDEVRARNKANIPVSYAIQTNGQVIDDEWARFLHEEKFLAGLSLDGNETIHDRLRKGAGKSSTFARVMETAELFRKYRVDFNILTVVTAYTAKNIDRIYRFFRKEGLLYQQYIPCLDPLGERRGGMDYSLTPELYTRFLKALFDLWYDDVTHGRFIYIRHFENMVGVLRGFRPEHCGMTGQCSMQSVIEADGSIYPCDFYVLDRYKLGNLNTDDYPLILENLKKTRFIEDSVTTQQECLSCRWLSICRGGCRRDRDDTGAMPGKNYFCSSYKAFYEYAMPRLMRLAGK